MSIIWVNGVQLGKKIGIKKARVSQLKKEGVFRLGLNGKYDLDECTKNFKEKRTNAPRYDQKNGVLPLGPTTTKEDKLAEFKDGVKKAQAGSGTYEFMLKSKAKGAYFDALRKEKLHAETARELVRRKSVYAVFLEFIIKNNSKIKAILLSTPKRLALGCPDPKLRAHVEQSANEIIRTALQELSTITPEIIDASVYAEK